MSLTHRQLQQRSQGHAPKHMWGLGLSRAISPAYEGGVLDLQPTRKGKVQKQMRPSAQRPQPISLRYERRSSVHAFEHLPLAGGKLSPPAERERRLSPLQEGRLSRWDWRPDLFPLICSFLRTPSPLSQNKMKADNRADVPLKTGHQQPRTPRGSQTSPFPKEEGALLWEGTSEDPC